MILPERIMDYSMIDPFGPHPGPIGTACRSRSSVWCSATIGRVDCRPPRPAHRRRRRAAPATGAVAALGAATLVSLSLATAPPAQAVPSYTPAAVTIGGTTPSRVTDIAVSPDGTTAYVLDGSAGIVYTVSGGTGTATVTTGLLSPSGLALAGTDLYISDTGHHRVVKIATGVPTPPLQPVAGTSGTSGAPTAGPAASSLLNGPTGLAWDPVTQSLYIADTGNNRVEKISGSTPTLSFVAGTGPSGAASPGPSAANSLLAGPRDVAVDSSGVLYIADTGNHAIEKVDSSGALTTVAASLTPDPVALTVDATGTLLAAAGSSVVTVTASGGTTTVPLSPVTLHTPRGLATTTAGVVWVADDDASSPQVVTLSPTTSPTSAPTITSAAAQRAATGVLLNRSLKADGYPVPTWSRVGGTLPAGLTLSPAGVLTGTPTAGGTSTFTVRASNGVGSVGYHDQQITFVVGAVPATIAAAPTVVSGQGSATLTWTAPTPPTDAATATAEAVTGYVVTPYAGTTAGTPKSIAAGTLTTTVTGLKSGTAYTFTVAATNAFGTGTASAASTALTPYGGIKEPAAGLTRYEGGNRVATAVKVSQQLFPDTGSARAVVVASSTSFADSLAGARLASAVGGPLLLTDPLALNSEVAAEVGRVLAVPTGTTGTAAPAAGTSKPTTTGTVYLLGGTTAVSGDVEAAVKAVNTKYVVTRLSGTDRFETATKIAAQVTVDDPVTGAPIYVASGTNYPDGLAVAALAARTGGVVLLTDGPTMPTATSKYLETRDPNSELLVAVGGPAAAATSGHGAERAIVGSDRYDTARKVAARFTAAPGAKAVRSVGLATGQNWPDALAGAAAMGNLGGPLLLTPQGSLSSSVASAVASISSAGKPSAALVFGGSTVVSTGASDDFAALVR